MVNVQIARSDVVTLVRTQDLTVVCEFKINGLPRKKKKIILNFRFSLFKIFHLLLVPIQILIATFCPIFKTTHVFFTKIMH